MTNLPKIEAEEPLLITVTKADIRSAKKKNPEFCALANAARRMPHIKGAFFFRTTAWIETEDALVRYMLPRAVTTQIEFFDRDKDMDTGTYELRPPTGSQTIKECVRRKMLSVSRLAKAKASGEKIRRPIRHRFSNVRESFAVHA